MYKDIIFSLASDTEIGGKNLRAGNYRLVYRANQLLIWDVRNIAVATLSEQIEFDELMLTQAIKVHKTITTSQYLVKKNKSYTYSYGSGWHVGSSEDKLEKNKILSIIEHADDTYYVFEKGLCFKKAFIDDLVANGTLVSVN